MADLLGLGEVSRATADVSRSVETIDQIERRAPYRAVGVALILLGAAGLVFVTVRR